MEPRVRSIAWPAPSMPRAIGTLAVHLTCLPEMLQLDAWISDRKSAPPTPEPVHERCRARVGRPEFHRIHQRRRGTYGAPRTDCLTQLPASHNDNIA